MHLLGAQEFILVHFLLLLDVNRNASHLKMRAGILLLTSLSGIVSALIAKAPTASITAASRVRSRIAEVTEAPAIHPDLLRRDINTGTRTAFLAETNVCGYLNGASSRWPYLPSPRSSANLLIVEYS
jgi:hypothetical protein